MSRTRSSFLARAFARGITTLSLCSLALVASAVPAHAVLDDCIFPASDQFNDGVADGDGVSGCTANDMGVASITSVVVLDDGCTSLGDTVTISGVINFDTTNPKRYDVAAYLATNGTDGIDANSNGPQCDIYIIPAPSSPENDGDQCGDYNGGAPAVTMTITSTTFSCVDLINNATGVAGSDGSADLQVCSSYKQSAGSTGEDACPNYTGAVPGTSSKCNCEQVALVPPIPIHQCTSGPCCDTSVSPHVFRTAGTSCRGAAGVCDTPETCTGTSSTCPADGLLGTTTVCRSANGVCDSAERCDGVGATCPTDTFQATTVTCRASSGAICDVAEQCTGTGGACPADGFAPTSTTCRASAGVCDSAEQCTGTSTTCPANTRFGTTTTCRSANGVCDIAEVCTGTADSCPSDSFFGTTTTCRSTNGVCDIAEVCSGTAGACPSDTFFGTTTTCRASGGVCDVAEVCSGTAGACPSDSLRPTSFTCRADAGECDVAETCNGGGTACPADGFESSGTSCGSASDTICDNADTCNGSGTCQPNNEANTVTCRADAGECDVAETCNGAGSCPADTLEPNGTSCGDGTDTICTNPDTCQAGVCNPNNEAITVTCRADAGQCDVAETCDGNGACPADGFEPGGTSCGSAGDTICDNADTCDGSGSCQTNNEANTVVCRADAGQCDVAETCDGAGSCPADTLEPNGTSCGNPGDTICDNPDTCSAGTCVTNNEANTVTCRGDAGECDVAETCDGAGSCPADTLEPNGTSCGSGADSICDNPDTCSAGSCVTNNEANTVTCRADAGECDVAETCDGAGSCPADSFESSGTACGDGTDTICSDPDTCDGSGACEANDAAPTVTCRADAGECDVAETCDGNGECPADGFENAGTACGDGTNTICTDPDTCDGSGACEDNDAAITVECRSDAGECDIAETCDGNGACPADGFESSGTACGDGTNTLCTDPDTCDGSGACEANDAAITVECRSDAGECDVAETCDGNGACPADGFESSGTACGDGTNTICTDPDTCDGSGACEANDAAITVECRSDAGECDVAETCDGNGACPADGFESSGTACGDGTDTICSDPDTCDGSGACEANDAAITVTCRADAGECDIAETCDGNGACPADVLEDDGTACGDGTDSICDNPDTCQAGSCEGNEEAPTVTCRGDAGQCDVPETCDGAGSCPADAFEASGTSCGSPGDSICDDPDTCDGSGTCDTNNEAPTVTCRADAGECDEAELCDGNGACPADIYSADGTACGDGTDSICDNPDTCEAGSCESNTEATTVTCRADAGECDVAETCDGNGACPADGFENAGTACGDGTDTICSDPDTCDGSGACEDNDAAITVECRSDAGECDVAETCDGNGACPADGFESSGTACGDGTDTICSDPDTCDGSGACEANDAAITVECRSDAGECDVAETCDGNGACPADGFESSGTACGDGTDTICTDPDTCDGSGACEDNDEAITVTCRAGVGQCDVPETCDGAGSCPADAFEAAGEPCGNPGDTICDDPDTCDGSGSCETNNAAITVECRSDAGECDVAETCDGNGDCPADAFEASGTSCGDGTDTSCSNPDTCDGSGACQANNETILVTCRDDAGECDVAETCDGAGNCPADGFEASGTSCGDGTDTICNNPDSCDGSGACQANNEAVTTTCRGDAGECDLPETCDGNGSCPADAFETDGTTCGSADDTECDNPDSCSAGACVTNNETSGTSCGDGTDTICDNADTCDGNGGCEANNEPATVTCRDDAGECDVPETCDGAGSCPADGYEASGTSCGDGTNTICDNADTCDGTGSCQDNVQPSTTTCRSEAGECDAPELCDGAGSCPADLFDAAGDPCGSTDDTECDNPDTCDGAGGCLVNNEAIGTTCGSGDDTICDNPDSCNATGSCASNAEPTTVQCRADSGQCDVPENCDGSGACPADGLEPNGTTCEDGNLCTEGETCQLGACTGALPVTCEDNDLCTAPSCDPLIGCTYEPDVAPLENCYHSSGGRLAISDRSVAVRDVIRWTWRRGEIINPADFGDPRIDTQYAVCIFDHTGDEPNLITSMNIPAAAPKWKAPKRNRWKYVDSPGTFDGLRKVRLVPKTKEYRSKVQVRARGVNLVLPPPFSDTAYMDVDSKVIVQLRTSTNACWQSSFNQSQTFRNSTTKFRAKYKFKRQYQDQVPSSLEEFME